MSSPVSPHSSKWSPSQRGPKGRPVRPAGPRVGGESHRAGESAAVDATTGRKVHAAERWLVRRVLQAMGNPPFAVVLWDGGEISTSDARPLARISIRDRRTLWQLVIDPDLYFGEAYSTNRIEIDGSLAGLLDAFHRASLTEPRLTGCLRRAILRWWHRTRSNTLRGARANIHHHYDVGNDFYRLWLDREMVYSCAYFSRPEATLDEAQVAKMDYICRKLRLQPGESVVDVGGGWGAMALYMARNYGVTVKAFNISHAQTAYARQRAKAEGLDSRVEFIEDDYRNISGRFDAFASLGMLEHVGVGRYREFGRVIDRCLGPKGRGLMQSIGQDRPTEPNPWIRRRIFPGGYMPTLREMMRLWEPYGFSVLDVENLRPHYARTLQHWLDRFESAAEKVAEMFDSRFVRIWQMYLTGSMTAFTSGALQLFQVLFARPGLNDVPWTRAGLYEKSGNAR